MKTIQLIGALALVVLSAAAGGCGYKFGSLYRTDVKTIAVPVWTRGHGVYRRGLEMDLTEAVIKRLQLDTRYRICDEAQANTRLTGRLDNVHQQSVTINTDTGIPREMEATFTVSFTWTDRRSGDELVRRERFPVTGRYIAPNPFNETFFTGSREAIDQAAQRIVEQLETGWPEPRSDMELN